MHCLRFIQSGMGIVYENRGGSGDIIVFKVMKKASGLGGGGSRITGMPYCVNLITRSSLRFKKIEFLDESSKIIDILPVFLNRSEALLIIQEASSTSTCQCQEGFVEEDGSCECIKGGVVGLVVCSDRY